MTLELLTHTKRRDWKNCHRYFLHRHVHMLALRAQKPGRRRGHAFGVALMACRVHLTETLKDAANAPHRDEWLRTVIRDAVDDAYVDVFPANSDSQFDIDLEKVKIRVMAEAYIERYGIDRRREVEFDLPLINPRTGLPSDRFRRAGKIDGVIVIGPTRVRVIEDKFVGQIQQVMIERLPLDEQIHEYTDAFNHYGWEAEIEYRHTRLPSINPTKSKTKQLKAGPKFYPGESLDAYEERLREDVSERLDFYFDKQGPLLLPTDVHDEYRVERWGAAQDIINAEEHLGKDTELETYYKNPSRCWEYGGCEYIPLCCKVPGAEDRYVVTENNPELSIVTAELGHEEV